jgi:carbonic anhydrase
MNNDFRPPVNQLFCTLILSILLTSGCTHTNDQTQAASPADHTGSSDPIEHDTTDTTDTTDSVTNAPEREAHSSPSKDNHAPSPIDIPEQAAAPAEPHRIALHLHETAEHIIHRKHTIELDVDPDYESGIDFDGQTYVLDQFHFHTPSEHLIGGHRYPVELHLVHRSSQNEVLVVGILFASGKESQFLEQILRDTPESLATRDRDVSLDLSDLFPEEQHFYSYRGSFTTPPYTEGVEWLVLRSHPEASAEQIVRLLILEWGNARDVQKKNDRSVERF